MVEIRTDSVNLSLSVGKARRVKVEGYRSNSRRSLIAPSYHPDLTVFREIVSCANSIGSRSNLVATIPDDEDPWSFVYDRHLIRAPDGKRHDGRYLAFEDPTVVPNGEDRIWVFLSAVEESRRFFRGAFEGSLHCLELDPRQAVVEDRFCALAPEDLPLRNLSYVKELECLPVGARMAWFLESGGPGLGSVVCHTESEPGDFAAQGRLNGQLRVWLEPRPRTSKRRFWDSTDVSTGPILSLGDNLCLMFYNGRGTGTHRHGEWAVGALLFQPNQPGELPRIIYRGEQPLIIDESRTNGAGKQIICFASSLRRLGRYTWVLYAHIADRYTVGIPIEIHF